jgi:hypothetical protein
MEFGANRPTVAAAIRGSGSKVEPEMKNGPQVAQGPSSLLHS